MTLSKNSNTESLNGNIFNNFIRNRYFKDIKQGKYVFQFVDKLKIFLLGSPNTAFKTSAKALKSEIIEQIDNQIKDRKITSGGASINLYMLGHKHLHYSPNLDLNIIERNTVGFL